MSEHDLIFSELVASYTYLKLMYLLVPAFTLLGSWALILLATYAW